MTDIEQARAARVLRGAIRRQITCPQCGRFFASMTDRELDAHVGQHRYTPTPEWIAAVVGICGVCSVPLNRHTMAQLTRCCDVQAAKNQKGT